MKADKVEIPNFAAKILLRSLLSKREARKKPPIKSAKREKSPYQSAKRVESLV